MIRIFKSPAPEWITRNRERLTNDFLTDQSKSPWRHEHIKSALTRETHSKCAYCESYIAAVGYVNVEHIRPKSRFPRLVLEWTNLVSACSRCNTNKGDYYSSEYPLIDPTSEDPSRHLVFMGAATFPYPGNRRAIDTIEVLQLNRADLFHQREKRINELLALLHSRKHCNTEMESVLDTAIAAHFEPASEYSAALLKFFNDMPGLQPKAPSERIEGTA
ncbi:HNH endonuclease [Dietzia sp. Die43]|uniref:HNH endonuclease n=1 Tax=Dietzia sp. Die43 TaxID=2926011 RepID=UPI0021190084|nr:HNH endonuclease [Dietzia sp. Die43]